MKRLSCSLILFGLTLLSQTQAIAQEVDGDTLNIGVEVDGDDGGQAGDGTPSYGANGFDNSTDFGIIGNENYMSFCLMSLVVGYQNNANSGFASLTVGQSNEGSSDYSLIVGYGNSAGTSGTLVSGEFNTVSSNNSGLVAGYVNGTSGSYQFALGVGLVAQVDSMSTPTPKVIVGMYNSTASATNQLFVVGNGTGTSSLLRKNAMEIYKDGTVKIPKRQGDIVMGEFGNGGGD